MNDMQIIQDYHNKSRNIIINHWEEPEVTWSILKRMLAYNEDSGNAKLYLKEKFHLINFPDSINSLNKRLLLIASGLFTGYMIHSI